MSIQTIQDAITNNIENISVFKHGREFSSIKELKDYEKENRVEMTLDILLGIAPKVKEDGYIILGMNESFIDEYLADKLVFKFDGVDAVNQEEDEIVYDKNADDFVCIYDAFSTLGLIENIG